MKKPGNLSFLCQVVILDYVVFDSSKTPSVATLVLYCIHFLFFGATPLPRVSQERQKFSVLSCSSGESSGF